MQVTDTGRAGLWRLLNANRHLAELPESLRRDLLGRFAVQRFNAPATVCKQGDVVQSWYGVLHGAVQVALEKPSGRRTTLCYLAPGAWLCDESILLSESLPYCVHACDRAELVGLPADQLRDLVGSHPALLRALLQMQMERVRYLDRQRLQMLSLSVSARLARRLLELSRIFGVRRVAFSLRTEIKLPLTQTDLAELLGVSRQTINHHIKSFRDRGLIDTAHGRFTLLDSNELERVSLGFDGELREVAAHGRMDKRS